MSERKVRDHAERLARKRDIERVGLDHPDVAGAHEPRAKSRDQAAVYLDGDDPARPRGQLVSEHAVARTELDDEVATSYAGVSNEISGDAGTKEVLTPRRGRAWT